MGPVLIVEDDPDIAEVLRYVLENENFATRVAHTGEEGLLACLDKHNPPLLILLDLLLPGMSGVTLPAAAQRIVNTKHAGTDCLRKGRRQRNRRQPRVGSGRLHHQTILGAGDHCARQFPPPRSTSHALGSMRSRQHIGTTSSIFAMENNDLKSKRNLQIESLPFTPGDVTAGTENELQALVIGKRTTVDLPITIERSKYTQTFSDG